MPIDILWGSDVLRTATDAGVPPSEIMEQPTADLTAFEEVARPYLLYR